VSSARTIKNRKRAGLYWPCERVRVLGCMGVWTRVKALRANAVIKTAAAAGTAAMTQRPGNEQG
jgi:hypothetical protein